MKTRFLQNMICSRMLRFDTRSILNSSRVRSKMQVPVIIRQYSIYTDKAVQYSGSEEAGQQQSSGGSPKMDSSIEGRILHLENHFTEALQDIGVIKGDLNTLKWQMWIMLTAILGCGGSVLGFFIKDKLFGEPKEPKEPGQPSHLVQHNYPVNGQQPELAILVEEACTKAFKAIKNTETKKTKERCWQTKGI